MYAAKRGRENGVPFQILQWNIAILLLTLNGHHQKDGENSHETRGTDFNVQEVAHDDGKEGSGPHGVNENGDQVEAIHVVAEQIDHFAGRRVAECVLRQPGRLPVDQAAHGHSDAHAGDEALVHKLVHVERRKQADGHDPSSRNPGIVFAQFRVVRAEELQEAAEQQRLDDAHHLAADGDQAQLRVLPPEREDDGLHQTGSLRCTVGQLSLPFPVRERSDTLLISGWMNGLMIDSEFDQIKRVH